MKKAHIKIVTDLQNIKNSTEITTADAVILLSLFLDRFELNKVKMKK